MTAVVPSNFYTKDEESSVEESVSVINTNIDVYDPLNPFHSPQMIAFTPIDNINSSDHSDLDNAAMAIFDNTRPVNSPADDQSDVSEYLPNSEDILTSIPCTSNQGMITTPRVEDNTTPTSSRT